ncbi:MAG: endonuclease/exonuclease/phosphatase family protein [Acidimicrobiia bacterium]
MARTLRIITANLLNGAASRTALRRLIRDERPDAFAAQELAPAAAAVIAGELPHGLLDPSLDYLGGGIALRRPGDVVRLTMEHRDGHRVLLEPGTWPELTAPLEIVAVHLMNPVLRPWRHSAWVRRTQVEQVLDHVRENRVARVIVGDFNATPAWRVYRKMAAVVQDAARVTGNPRRTWAPWWWMPRLLRIDHGFVEGVVPLSVRTRRVRGADHSALIVDVRA